MLVVIEVQPLIPAEVKQAQQNDKEVQTIKEGIGKEISGPEWSVTKDGVLLY